MKYIPGIDEKINSPKVGGMNDNQRGKGRPITDGVHASGAGGLVFEGETFEEGGQPAGEFIDKSVEN